MAEKITVKNGQISNFEGLVTLTFTKDRVILHRALPTCQISLKSKKTFCGRTDVHTYVHGRKDIWDWLY